MVEKSVCDRRVQVPEANLGIPNVVRRHVRAGQGDGSLIDIGQDDVAALGEPRRDDSDRSIAAAQVQDRLTRSQLDRLEEQLGPSVEIGTGEHAGIRAEYEGMISYSNRDLGRSSR